MSAIERLLAGALLLVVLSIGGALGVRYYGAQQFAAGRAAAIADGQKQRDREAIVNRQVENELRDQLAARDLAEHRKDEEHAQALADAQRRVRAGTDRLRCPASAVQPPAAPDSGPAAAEPAADPGGPDIVPEVAAEILGDGSAVAGLVRRYERVVERFEACRSVNATP